jgi:hypothetical protein
MAPDVDLAPHPLVPRVAERLEELGEQLTKAAKELLAAQPPRELDAQADEEAAAKPKKKGKAKDAGQSGGDSHDETLALGLAAAADVPELVTFAGYVGAILPREHKNWCVFYLDTRLLSWLLVLKEGIVFREKVKEEKAPFGQRDVLWVKEDTPVGIGSGSLSAEAQFLTGAFTRAGDFDGGPQGTGTIAAATGVFCEARSVGCCRPRTERRP